MSGIWTTALAAADSGTSKASSLEGLLKVILHDFPAFFDGIVKTTIQAGPLALGILLLFILGFLVYWLKGTFASNRVLAFVGGLFVLVVGGTVLLFVYQAFQYYLQRQSADTLIFMQGKLTYSNNVQELARGGDLYIEMWAAKDQLVGESRQRFYSYDDGIAAKKILATAKPDRIELTIKNRALYKICNEDSPKLNERNPQIATKYTIIFDRAYLASGDSGIGIEQYNINFRYDLRHGAQNYDFLSVDGFKNIDPDKVSIQVSHTPDYCIDDDPRVQYTEIIKGRIADSPARSLVAKLLHSLGELIFTRALSQQAPSASKGEIVSLLGAADPSLVTKARAEISQKPSDFADLLNQLLHQRDAKYFQAQLNALTALKGASPKTFKLANAITDIVELSYLGSPELRQAARSYLTDLEIVDDAQAKMVEIYVNEKTKARQAEPNQYGLLLVTAREIYYVAGVKQLVNYVGDWGNRERMPEAIEPSLRNFQLGVDMIADVPNEIVVPFAKPYYGKALALRSRTAVNAALAKLGVRATSKQVDKEVTELVAQRAPLPFNDAERNEFFATIDKFLSIVNGREPQYLWPDHIKSLKKCREQVTYDCLHSE